MTQFSSLYGRLLTQEIGSEDSTVLFTDARRKAGINDGIQEFADLTECYVRVQSIPSLVAEQTLSGTVKVAGGDFVRLSAKQSVEAIQSTGAGPTVIEIVGGDDLRQVDIAWLNRYEPGWNMPASTSPQSPRRFYLRPDGGDMWIGLWPVPVAKSSGIWSLTVPYVARPEVLTSDTSEPFTVSTSGVQRTDLRIYHRAFVHYAAHQMEKLRRDEVASDRQLQRFLSYVTRYTQSFRQKGGTALTFARRYFGRSITATSELRDPRT